MQKLNLLFAFISIFGLILADAEVEDGVLVLTKDNFDEELAKYPQMLVEFYAPWCGHCKKLAPEYAEAAAELAKQESPVKLAKVDMDQHGELKSRFGVKSFPTLYWFVNGKKHDYTGGRTRDTILHWIDKKTGPAFKSIESCDEIKETAAKKKFNLIYFGDLEGADYAAFQAQWEEPSFGDNPKFAFIHGHNDCAAEYGASVPGFVLVRDFEEPVTTSIGEPVEITKWIRSHQLPNVINFDEDAIEPIFAQRRDSLVLFTNDGDDNDYSRVFADVAKELHGEVLYVRCGTQSKVHKKLSGFLNIDDAELPTLRLLAPGKTQLMKYRFEGSVTNLNADEAKQFVRDFKDGKLSPFFRSEDVPASQEGPVTVVVGKNFNEIVRDQTKDVLIEFYAPWCGHCKKLAPTWEELAANYAEISDVVIAKMDATANEVQDLSIRGYPTIRWYPKDNKQGSVVLEGDQNLDDFTRFLEENSMAVKEHRGANQEQN